ncbi:Transposase [Bacteroidales bacterium Barb4]|nr:Transposase [Bacteroidales bacterium Barb4]
MFRATKNRNENDNTRIVSIVRTQDCIIMTDATKTQTAIAEKIVEKEADYILVIKDNQKTLREEKVITFPVLLN